MAKAERVLSMYDRLLDGKMIRKTEEAVRFHVNTRTIQRDLDDIRAHLSEERHENMELVYDRKNMAYVIRKNSK